MKDALVITIAHRLLTVIGTSRAPSFPVLALTVRHPSDYDRILVLDAGCLVEYDTPRALLELPGGKFRKFCDQSADRVALRRAVGLGGSSKQM